MEYSSQEIEIIYQMKRSIVSEFRYHYIKSDNNAFGHIFYESDFSLSIKHLKDAYRLGMSTQEKKILRKYKWMQLFNQALFELFTELIINYSDAKTVFMTNKGEEMLPNRKPLEVIP
jgi:hypothetical protein